MLPDMQYLESVAKYVDSGNSARWIIEQIFFGNTACLYINLSARPANKADHHARRQVPVNSLWWMGARRHCSKNSPSWISHCRRVGACKSVFQACAQY